MAPTPLLALSGYLLRRYHADDHDQVLALIEADRLPGQSSATPHALADALIGDPDTQVHGWTDLADLRTDVLVTTADHGHDVVGVVCYARSQHADAGALLWLHARERPDAVVILIHHVLGQLEGCARIRAFSRTIAFAPRRGALPICHRPVTAAALHSLGFTATERGRYIHRELAAGERFPVDTPPDTDVTGHRAPGAGSWTVTARHHGVRVGHAGLTVRAEGLGELSWWVNHPDRHHCQLLGRALLYAALDQLRDAGVIDVIILMPTRDRNHSEQQLIEHLHRAAGFSELDRLMVFTQSVHNHPRHTPASSVSSPALGPGHTSSAGAAAPGEHDEVPLLRMLSTVDTDTTKTVLVQPEHSSVQLTPEVFRMLCDVLDAIKKHLREDHTQ